MKDLMHEYEANRRIIMDLKMEFIRFRTTVLSEINNQKDMVSRTIA
jgi:hypothetical protein